MSVPPRSSIAFLRTVAPVGVRATRALASAALACSLLGGVGCASYNERADAMLGAFVNGRYEVAADAAMALTTGSPARDRVLTDLEAGATLVAAGRFDEADRTFERAYDRIGAIGDPEGTDIGEAVGATLTNLTSTTYRGWSSDRVMLATYKALSALAQGDRAGARVELTRARFFQEDAEARFRAAIDAARERVEQDAAAESGRSYDVDRALADASVQRAIDAQQARFRDRFQPYEGFTNPYTELVTALFMLARPSGAGDVGRAQDAIARVTALAEEGPSLASLVEDANRGRAIERSVVVLVETDLAPQLVENSFAIPSFFAEMPFIGIALPELVPSPRTVGSIEAIAGGARWEFEIGCELDSVIAQEFEEIYPGIVAATIAQAASRAAITLGANLAAKSTDDDLIRAITFLATNLYGYATTRADLRRWRTLPKTVHWTRIPAPADGRVELLVDGDPFAIIEVDPERVTLVHARLPVQSATATAFAVTIDGDER